MSDKCFLHLNILGERGKDVLSFPLFDKEKWKKFRLFFQKKIKFNSDLIYKDIYASNNMFDCKYIVMGENPVLAAISLLHLARKNIKAVYCPIKSNGLDCWSYDFFKHPDFRTLIEEYTGFRDMPNFQPDWDLGFEADNDEAVEWVNNFFGFIGDEIKRLEFEGLVRIDEDFIYTLHDRKLDYKNYILFSNYDNFYKVFSKSARKKFRTVSSFDSKMARFCHDAFWSKVLKDIKLIKINKKDNLFHHILCDKIILTSLIENFTGYKIQGQEGREIKFYYDNRFIIPLGSANMHPIDPQKSVEQAFSDIRRLSRVII